MKTITAVLVLSSLFCGANARAQIVLQDFSSTLGANTFFEGTWEAANNTGGSVNPNSNFVQGAGVFDVTGTTGLVPTNAAASKVEFFYGTALSIGTSTSLSVSAQALGTNAASSFTVTLFDLSAKTAFATFSTLNFVTGGYTTITGELTFQSGFSAASINSMIVSGNQPFGTDRFNVSFDHIAAVSAIPEPGVSAALAGVLALGFAVRRRRNRPGRTDRGVSVY